MANKPKVKPSLGWIWLGVFMMLLSPGGCFGGGVWGYIEAAQEVDDALRITVPGEDFFDFESTDSASLFAIGESTAAADSVSATVVETESGNVVPLETNVNVNGGSGDEFFASLGRFAVEEGVSYTVTATGRQGAEVGVVAYSIESFTTKLIGGIAIGAVLLFLGFLIVLIAGLRRRSNRKNLQTPTGPAGGSQAYAPTGYPQPVGGQPAGAPQTPGYPAQQPPNYPPPQAPGGFTAEPPLGSSPQAAPPPAPGAVPAGDGSQPPPFPPPITPEAAPAPSYEPPPSFQPPPPLTPEHPTPAPPQEQVGDPFSQSDPLSSPISEPLDSQPSSDTDGSDSNGEPPR